MASLGVALAHRAVNHARLTEAAALGAAARDLDRTCDRRSPRARPPGRRRGKGNCRGSWTSRRSHRVRRALVLGVRDDLEPAVRVDRGRVERGHVDAAESRPDASGVRGAARRLRFPSSRVSAISVVASSPSPMTKASMNARHGFGVGGHGPARDDQRIVVAAVLAAERDAAEVEHREDVGVGELVLQREADDVEVAERARRLERHEGSLPFSTSSALHVDPRACTPVRRACAGRRSGSDRGS